MTNSRGTELVNGVGKVERSISSIQSLLAKLPEEHSSKKFQIWLARSHFYLDMPGYKPLASWFKSKKLLYQLSKLFRATQATLSLHRLRSGLNPEQQKLVDNMLEITNRYINIELKKIEIDQLRKLQKIQNISREEVSNLKSELAGLRELNRVNLQRVHSTYSTLVKDLSTLPLLNQSSNKNDLKIIRTFFKNKENKIHFAKHLSKSTKVSDAHQVASQSINFFAMLGSLFPTLITLGVAFKSFVQAIPAVSLIINTVPHVISLVKGITRQKSKSKIIGPIIAIALSVIALAVTTFVPITGVIIGFTCLMASVSLGMGRVAPLWQTSSVLKKKNNELAELTLIELERGKESQGLTSGFFALSSTEKQFLLVTLEKYYLNHLATTSLELISSAKKSIQAGEFSNIAKDPLVRTIIAEQPSHQKNLSALLKTCNQSAKDLVIQEINGIKKDVSKKRVELINGIMSWVGVGLVCIPTPPTMIIGASLLFVSSIVTLSMKYGWHTKIKNAFSSLFKSDTNKLADKAENDNSPKLKDSPALETHAIVKKAMTEAKPPTPIPDSILTSPLAPKNQEMPPPSINRKFTQAIRPSAPLPTHEHGHRRP